MFSFELNNEGFNNSFDGNDHISFHIYDLLEEPKKEIEEQKKIKEIEKRDILSKEYNDNNSTFQFQETKRFLCESFNFEKTDSNSKIFLKIKRKRNQGKNCDENKDNILDIDNSKEKSDINVKGNIKRGRRKKDVKYDSDPGHDKFKGDNIIQKIKKYIFDYILEHLNKSLKNEIYKFYPLSKKLNSNTKKDFNEKLLERTIYDIYMNSDLSGKYINIPESNRELITKIYDEKIEKETIDILEKKFKDILDYIREKDLDNFLNNFRLKEKKKDAKLIDSYMKEVKKMLFIYEFWFKVKIARNRIKK